MKKIDVLTLSDFIITYFETSGDFISNKKLQKLLFYIQAWHLVYFDKYIFSNRPEAWVHGPVYREVYDLYKKFGSDPLKSSKSFDTSKDLFEQLEISTKQKQLIKAVLLKYSLLSAYQLEVLSHSETPWLEQRKGLSDFERSEKPISFSTMKSYYSSLLEN